MEHYLTDTDNLIHTGGKNIFFFHSVFYSTLTSLLTSLTMPPLLSPSLLLSWDPSSIILNSSSKPSTPPHPPRPASRSHHYFGFMSWMSSVSFMHPSTISKVKSNTDKHPHPLPPCPRRVEQKVTVISSPLGHNGGSCAAPTECDVLFWRQRGQSTDRYWLACNPPSHTNNTALPTHGVCLNAAALCPLPVEWCASFFRVSVYWDFKIGK